MIEAPQGFILKTQCQKAAKDKGFRSERGEAEGWARYESPVTLAAIHLAGAGPDGPWLLAPEQGGLVVEIGPPPAEIAGPGGLPCYRFESLAALYEALDRVYHLAPKTPLEVFAEKLKTPPATTEVEQLIRRRVGQEAFREALMSYWNGRCPLTQIEDAALLRASHIVPWKDCATDAERLDVHNGLLLSAHWDAAFDRGLVSFGETGEPMFSPRLSAAGRAALIWSKPLPLKPEHKTRLAYHRGSVFQAKA